MASNSEFLKIFRTLFLAILLTYHVKYFEGQHTSTVQTALYENKTLFPQPMITNIQFRASEISYIDVSTVTDKSVNKSIMLFRNNLEKTDLTTDTVISEGIAKITHEDSNDLKNESDFVVNNSYQAGVSKGNAIRIVLSTVTPSNEPKKSQTLSSKIKGTIPQPGHPHYPPLFPFMSHVPSLPGFYSFTAISAEMVQLNVSHPSQLECSSVHHYCSFPNSYLKVGIFNCSCSKDCLDYGDCCWDAPVQTLREKHRRVSCVSMMDKYRMYKTYYMMTYCSSEWEDVEIRLLCESPRQQLTDEFLKIPVTSLESGITYQNIYCAVCNEDINVTIWESYLINCSLETFNNNMTSDERHRCAHAISLPPLLLDGAIDVPKSCDSSVISNCLNWWFLQQDDSLSKTKQVHKKCLSYYAPVKVSVKGIKMVFKNKYCAFCNGISVEHLTCTSTEVLKTAKTEGVILPSYSLLMDIDFVHGGNVIGRNERCPRLHVYDPWKNMCRNVFCGRLFQNTNGICIQKSKFYRNNKLKLGPDSGSVGWLNSSIRSNCPKIAVSDEEFIVSDNDTITLLATKERLEVGEYEPVTSKSILICILKRNFILKFDETHGYLTVVCISISLICLFGKIFNYFFMSEGKKLPARIVLFLSISLFLAQSLFLFGIHKTEFQVACSFIGIAMHYFFLASFFWVSVLAFDIWKTFSSLKMVKSTYAKNQFLKYCACGWLTPLFIVVIALLFNLTKAGPLYPGYGDAICWISNRMALLIFFATPLGLLLISNLACFILTAIKINKTDKTTRTALENNIKKDKIRFILYIKLALIMGLTWVFGFFAAYADSDILWYSFITFNGLQGAFIFLALTQFRIPKRMIRLQMPFRFSRSRDVNSKQVSFQSKSLATRSSKL